MAAEANIEVSNKKMQEQARVASENAARSIAALESRIEGLNEEYEKLTLANKVELDELKQSYVLNIDILTRELEVKHQTALCAALTSEQNKSKTLR